jgi:AcrR family transcriptional regulator
MGRWKPDAQARLEKAALALFREHGFAQTTVAEIAERAGLTERTFFRYFTDKREVLFSGGAALQEQLLRSLDDAPAALAPLDAVARAIESTTAYFELRKEYARTRSAVIAENAELQERERIKMASLASALADGLRRRGAGDSVAIFAAEMGMMVFRISLERWIGSTGDVRLSTIMREALNELKLVSAGK